MRPLSLLDPAFAVLANVCPRALGRISGGAPANSFRLCLCERSSKGTFTSTRNEKSLPQIDKPTGGALESLFLTPRTRKALDNLIE